MYKPKKIDRCFIELNKLNNLMKLHIRISLVQVSLRVERLPCRRHSFGRVVLKDIGQTV